MSDEEENERFEKVIFGTPLPELREDEVVRKKPINLEDQIVTDENGRRRFHGAFTGGFSAGFFNTVGSRDGWTPRTFKSGSGKTNFTPDDFMDDEDRGEYGIAPKKLQASADFRSSASSSKNFGKLTSLSQIFDNDRDAIVGSKAVFDSLFIPSQETVGIRLLKEMGWRPGQGIGPRLHKKAKIRQKKAHQRMFGTKQDDKEEADDEDEMYKEFLFAPDDIPSYVTKPKDNYFGIGYKGLDRASSHLNLFAPPTLTINSTSKKKKAIVGQAFGVGAFEEDDDDIYAKEDLASKYDFYLDDPMGRGSEEKKRKRKSRWDENQMPSNLEGFVPSTSKSAIKRDFPLPQIPKDFKAKCKVKRSRFEPLNEAKPLADSSNNSRPPQPEPVVKKPTTPSPIPKPTVVSLRQETSEDLKQFVDDLIAKGVPENNALFKPYAKYPEKQLRYEQFLVCLRNGKKDALSLLQPKDMSEAEKEHERDEFERAAMLYQRKTSFAMSSRFVTSSTQEDLDLDGGQPKPALTDAEVAVQKKFFGPLTREKVEWHPCKILCMRFNVKQPYGDPTLVGVPAGYKCKLDLFSRVSEVKTKANETVEKIDDPVVPNDPEKFEQTKNEKEAQEGLEEPETEKTEEFKKASNELFKSIFLDDDDSSEDEEEEEAEEPPAQKPQPNSGLFANIDFNSFKTKANDKKPTEIRPEPQKKPVKRPAESDDEEDIYGPAKPKKPMFSLPSKKPCEEDADLGDWSEKSSHKVQKKKSKKEKHKKSKKKSKKKSSKKKKKRRYSSTSSSESSD